MDNSTNKNMDHITLEKMASTAPMLPAQNGDEKLVILTPGTNGKILIREDTILTNLNGCTGCGRARLTCSSVESQWSVLCWGQHSEKKYYTLLVLLSATFALSLIGTIFFCFTNTINDAILSNMVIRNNSMAYSVWKRPNVQPLMKVHLFNYSNWQEVKEGREDKLKVTEMGPYVYSQQLERINIKFKEDKLSYQETNIFKYLPDKSAGASFDQLYVPNLPLLGVVSKAISMNMNRLAQIPLNSALYNWANHPHAFVKLPVHRFLWGYDDTIISTAKTFLGFQGQFNYEKFGLLVSKNLTVSEQFTINTGVLDMHRMNIIEEVDGMNQLPYWSSPECNSIDASDGSIFPPSMLDKNQTLFVLYPNLCRRLPFRYEKEIEIADGIKLLRYRMPDNVFDYGPDRNPGNQCYCEMDSGVCPPQGVINVTACTMGAPAMASFPHFYLGDPKLREDVLGLTPDPERHYSYVDIHPTLGIALQGRSSLQINMQVRKTDLFTALSYLEEGLILPVAWVEFVVEELPESLKTLVYHGTYSTAAVQLGLTVSCIFALMISTICLIIMIKNRRQKPCITIKTIPSDSKENGTPLS